MRRSRDEALRRAVLDYDLDEAEKLLRAGADPNVLIGQQRAKSPFSNPSFAPTEFRALHLAANDDDVELAALLLSHGANPNQKIYAGALPISIAAQSNHLATAELLLRHYRRPAGSFAFCPLALAAANGHLAMVELLLEKKLQEMPLDPALRAAVAKKGNIAITKRLVAAGARADWLHPNLDPKKAVTTRMTALHPQTEALPLFLGHGQLRLIDAAIDGDLPAVERFLAEGASPDDADAYGHTTALSAASRCGQTAVVRQLLDAGAQLYGPKHKSDPLFQSFYGAQLATASLLWERGCRTHSMIDRVVRLGLPFESVRWVLDHDRDPDAALYAAAQAGRLDVARLALERGADPSYRRHGRSVLMVAASRHRPIAMVELLVAHGADVHAVDNQGWTAMHYALFRDDPDDPDLPFDYTDAALDSPLVNLLRQQGLAIPERGA